MLRRVLMIAALFMVILLVGVGLRFLGMVWAMQGMSSDRAVVEVDQPVNLASAKSCPIPLPQSACRIRYGLYAEWIAYEAYVRFEAPVEDCQLHARRMMDQYNKEHPDHPLSVRLTSIAEAPSQFRSHELKLTWFDPQRITHGSECGQTDSHTPKIWIDEDRGVFYYRLTD